EVLDDGEKFLERLDLSLLVLDGSDANRLGQVFAVGLPLRSLFIFVGHGGIAPTQVYRISHRFNIGGEVSGENANDLESIAELEVQDRVFGLSIDDLLHIVLRRGILLRAPRIRRQPPTEDDALEAPILTQFLPL